MSAAQREHDRLNSEFWDELCGTTLARSVGVTDASPQSLARFDAAYLDMYPYLLGYVPAALDGERVLEIGLGYGTLGRLLASRGGDYHGIDIARGPVEMMRHRLEQLGIEDAERRVVLGSALELPHAAGSFDRVFSIGCLHHTGDLPRAISEVHRTLRTGGTAVVMLYNRHSLRRLQLGSRGDDEVRATYDRNTGGDPAPVTEFVSRRRAKELFARFSTVRVRAENFDELSPLRGRVRLPRRWFLGNLARLAGLDLYVVAKR